MENLMTNKTPSEKKQDELINSSINKLFVDVSKFVRQVRHDVNNNRYLPYDKELGYIVRESNSVPDEILSDLKRMDIDGVQISLLELKNNSKEYLSMMQKFLFSEKGYIENQMLLVDTRMNYILTSKTYDFNEYDIYMMDMFKGIIKDKIKAKYNKAGQVDFDIGVDEKNKKLVLRLNKDVIRFSFGK